MLRLPCLLAALSLAAGSLAQDAAALAQREQKLEARAVPALHALADAYQAQKQHASALALRRELLLEYAEDDAKARDKCGFTKVGDQWRADAGKLVIDKNLTGDAKVLKKVEHDLAALQKELLAEHRALAEGWTGAGDLPRAARHWRRVLRFQPGDKKASEALAVQKFEGFGGNPQELGMLRRARAIRGAVDWLRRRDFVVARIDDRKHPLLERAQLAHLGVRSEHYEVWGTLPEAQLTLVAKYMERALLLCHTLLGTSEGAPFVPDRRRDLLLVADDAAYSRVLDLCADQFDAARLHFLKTDVDLAYLKVGEADWRFVKTKGGDEEALDQAVRGVVQDAVGVRTNGLWEGLGHAACGFFFGRTLTFLLEQQKEKTSASFTQKLLVPDMDVWRQIAEQSAWAKSDTRTSELVLLSAARFTTEQRVKAWAICDYLLHWRPELLHELDRSQTKDIHTPPEVEAEFLRRTQQQLPQIDQAWRDFWAKGEALRKAMMLDPLGDEKARDRALRTESLAVVDAVNELRAAARRGPVGFYLADDPDVQAAQKHAEALAKAELEQQKKPKVKVPMPVPPAAIGRTLLWAREKPAAAVASWACRPSWRDAMLHPGRGLLGAQQGKLAVVLDLTEPVQATVRGLPLCWPRSGQTGVPAAAPVASLGPRAVAAITAAGKQPGEQVGMPLSLHFARALAAAELAEVDCSAYQRGVRLDGVLVAYQAEGPDDDRADGCFAFVPFAPLAAGSEVEVLWTVPKALLPKDETFAAVRFVVQ